MRTYASLPGCCTAIAVAIALCATPALSASLSQDLTSLSLEQLANIEITSVSGRAEQLSDAPASVYVITNDDIRRSGARTLPEALRLAPNLQVARVSASSYAISARGMNAADNKLLVLLDGRILYTPLYSGVLWYAQDVMLEDVERIEVISGPGSTVWGSNAVNGVINVITKPAAATQGALLAGGAGNTDRGAEGRYGADLGNGKLRVYAKTIADDRTDRSNGTELRDARDRSQAGFRVDWDFGVTLQGDVYSGKVDQPNRDRSSMSGGNLLSTWNRALADGGNFRAQAYFDRSELEIPAVPIPQVFKERLDILDASFQHDLPAWHDQSISWGGEYRHASDRLQNVSSIAYLPDDRDLHWASLFAQDRATLGPSLDLTAGVRLEHNSYTGLEAMPSLRLSWKSQPRALVWGEVSRAVRTPSRLDRDLYAPANPPFIIAGGPNFRSETADVVELGYRAQPTDTLSYSATAFAHRYRHLRSVEIIDGHFIQVANQMYGTATGVEGWATWQVMPNWRLFAGGVYLRQRLHLRADSTDPTGTAAAGDDPPAQWQVRSSFDLPRNVELDFSVRHVGALPSPEVPAYTAVDARIGWRVQPGLELSVVGENLFDPAHVEFGSIANGSAIPRTVFFKVVWTL